MANHNRLLGRVKGTDGIKTGYTRASGFNLVTSVGDGKRRIVAVVMGGQTGRARDNHMADLIKKYLPKASVRDGGDLIAKSAPETVEVAVAEPAQRRRRRSRRRRPSAAAVAKEVETIEEPGRQAYAEPTPKPKALAAVDPVSTSSTGPRLPAGPSRSPRRRTAGRPSRMLAKTGKQASSILADAAAYTVPFDKDGTTYYRVRFGGFSSKSRRRTPAARSRRRKSPATPCSMRRRANFDESSRKCS